MAKEASSKTAKIAVASRDVARVVYGSVKIGRFRSVDLRAMVGEWAGRMGRRTK